MIKATSSSAGSLKLALDCQQRILPTVSRTFALTIPVLPDRLRISVSNAYLLCRLADTIEDDPGLDEASKREFGQQFIQVINGQHDADCFSAALLPRLSTTTLDAEKNLIANYRQVVEVTHSLSSDEQSAIIRCLEVMTNGMFQFQQTVGLQGLADVAEVDEYCYFVAGVVGEMLTELFCCYCPQIAAQRRRLMQLAPSFGQGLQMTNILKDIWEDRRRGACWLPRAPFGLRPDRYGDLIEEVDPTSFRAGISELISIAHRHLGNALDYTLLIPGQEKKLRCFCLWATGMAVLTLRKIHRNLDFTSGRSVKIKRHTVHLTVGLTRMAASRDQLLRWLFAVSSLGLPKGPRELECNWPCLFDSDRSDEFGSVQIAKPLNPNIS